MSAPLSLFQQQASRLLLARQLAHLRPVTLRDAGHGYDVFGQERAHVALGLALVEPLHRLWFRVQAYGVEHVPAAGRAILASNHSGTLPFDAVMLWADVLLRRQRVPRPVADYFVSGLPFISTLFARAGVVAGTQGNLRVLMEAEELVMIFPEGVPGIGKPFRERYHLQEWRVGHAELALRYRAPVVPVAVIGAEEQMPQVARIEALGPLVGAPYLPVPATLLPLPVRYHLHYGEPLRLHEGHRPEDADDPEVVHRASERVREAVQDLIERGLRQRRGVFR